MTSKSITGATATDIKTALETSMADGFKPTLAIVFLTDQDAIDSVTTVMDEAGIALFGASTSQKFSEQGIDEAGVVVLLMDMNPANFKIVLKSYNSLSNVYEAACEIGDAGKNSFQHPAFIISTADLSTPGGDVIKGLLDKAGMDVSVIGGMAGEPVRFSGIVFTNQSKSNSGIISLIVDEDKVDVKGVAVSGWKPIGTEKKITKSNGNWVYTIDNEPAVEVIKRFLGKDMVVNDKSTGIDSFPLQVQRAGGKPMMRPIVFWNHDEQSIMLGAPVDEGAMFRFSLPPDLEVIDAVIESTQVIKDHELPDADAMIVFSCVGRLSSLGPMLTMELEGLAATWNKPMVGFFSLGEYGKLDDTRPEFHGTTVSWVALKEK